MGLDGASILNPYVTVSCRAPLLTCFKHVPWVRNFYWVKPLRFWIIFSCSTTWMMLTNKITWYIICFFIHVQSDSPHQKISFLRAGHSSMLFTDIFPAYKVIRGTWYVPSNYWLKKWMYRLMTSWLDVRQSCSKLCAAVIWFPSYHSKIGTIIILSILLIRELRQRSTSCLAQTGQSVIISLFPKKRKWE